MRQRGGWWSWGLAGLGLGAVLALAGGSPARAAAPATPVVRPPAAPAANEAQKAGPEPESASGDTSGADEPSEKLPPAVPPVVEETPASLAGPPPRAVSSSSAAAERLVRVEIRFRNDVGKAFRLVSGEILLDGKPLRAVPADTRELPAFSGTMRPGSHLLTARLEYQGQPRGPFTYTRGYSFHVETTGAFVVPEDHDSAGFTVVSRERKGMNVPVERRLGVAVEPMP